MGDRIKKPDTQIHHEVLEELKWDPRVDETEVTSGVRSVEDQLHVEAV